MQGRGSATVRGAGRVRSFLIAIGIARAVIAAAFVFALGPVAALWPMPDTTPISFLFLGSILAAAAASNLWAGLGRHDAAFAGIALYYITIFVPTAVLSGLLALGVVSAPAGVGVGYPALALLSVALIAFGVWLYRWSRQFPTRDPRPTPRLVQISFWVFIAALVVLGLACVAGVPNILPWKVTVEQSRVFGAMFIGAAAYFAYGAAQGRWEHAAGQLAGVLAYDLVLIVPFSLRLGIIEPALFGSLVICLIVLSYSGALAIWYLFLDPRTRLGSVPPVVTG